MTDFSHIGDGSVVKFVADNHAVMLRKDGRLLVWGDNAYGQLGLGSVASMTIYEPTELTYFRKMGVGISDVAVCEDATFVLLDNSELYSFGRGLNGRLGNGDITNFGTPTLVPDSQSLRLNKLYSGKEFVVAASDDNSLYTWGKNDKGQCGNNTKVDVMSPIKIMDNADIKYLNVGADFVTLHKQDNSYWVWGNNDNGRYGFDTNCAVVDSSSCAGASKCGYIPAAQTVPNMTTVQERNMPFNIVTDTNRQFNHPLNTIFNNQHTGTFTGTSNVRSYSAASTQHLHGAPAYTAYRRYKYTLPNAWLYFDTGKIASIQLGDRHGIVNIDGEYYGWGDNSLRQQGSSGDANGYMTPLTQINDFIKNLNNTVAGFRELVVARDTNYILSGTGDVYSWGGNLCGKAGLGSTASYIESPSLIPALENKRIGGVVSGRNTAYYISHDGTVYASGDNLYGQTGLGGAQKNISKIISPMPIETFNCSEDSEIEFTLAHPKESSGKPYRLSVNLNANLPDGSEVMVEVCNNAFDDSPVWEDITTEVTNNRVHIFANTVCESGIWGVDLRVSIRRGQALGNCYVSGFIYAFEAEGSDVTSQLAALTAQSQATDELLDNLLTEILPQLIAGEGAAS